MARDEREGAPTVVELRQGVDRLAFMRGDWRGARFAPARDGGWEEVDRTSLNVAPEMIGLYLATQVRTAQYLYAIVIVSRDDQSGLIDVYEGGFDAGSALVVDNIQSGTHYRSGDLRVHNRMTFAPLAGGGWTWLVEATADGGATWRSQIRIVANSEVATGLE